MRLRWLLVLAACLPLARPALGQSPAETQQTAAYAAALQNPDGGFGPTRGAPSTLGGTNSALRVLRFTGGVVRDLPGCIAFVEKCRDAQTGGFAQTPGGPTDPVTTAIGLMALVELKVTSDEVNNAASRYFHERAKAFEEIRMAAAGLEAIAAKSDDFPRWAELVNADRNADGTWGTGPGQAFATGGAAAALLRMGLKPEHQDAVVEAMKRQQAPDGGWSDGKAAGSTLGASYRITRALFMLRERPDLERLATFLKARRNADGGYGPQAGAPSDISSTYYALIMTDWSRRLTGEPPLVETAGFVPLFNGQNLEGWEGDTELWKVVDGRITAESQGLKHNDFLATTGSYGDFVFKATFRLKGDESANSGIMLRASRVPPHEMSGYQADAGQNFWGCLYDESRRNKVLVPAAPEAVKEIHHGDWNQYTIRAFGPKITLTLNGRTSVEYTEPDPAIARSGKFGLQVHAGNPLTVAFKDIYVQPVPSPSAEADSTKPGFHVRTVETPGGTRKYTVYVPEGYDGKTAMPVVLFLHGAGERGEDGLVPAQVGLGPAILAHPERFPCLVVFPQARETWAAGSADSQAAVSALEDVLKTYKTDPGRLVLTGLSMGGRGTWELAAASPRKFAAIAPICGPGRLETVEALKGLPVWAFNGDEDRPTTVYGLRDMVAALKKQGNEARLTEYRGVGHNSWDRAYSDPELAAWLLKARPRGL